MADVLAGLISDCDARLALYRGGLNITQGKAFSDESDPDDE
jgi:hypothetical protein